MMAIDQESLSNRLLDQSENRSPQVNLLDFLVGASQKVVGCNLAIIGKDNFSYRERSLVVFHPDRIMSHGLHKN